MKKVAIICLSFITINKSNAQQLQQLLQKTGISSAQAATNNGTDIAKGLKEALNSGVSKGVAQLSAVDGFLGNAAIKILMPAEAQKMEQKLRALGFGSQVDDAITSMNRAAEDATKSASPIFLLAIEKMSFKDAVAILHGSDTAATAYLQNSTTTPLTAAFKPIIENSLTKVAATKYWNTMITTYNQIPFGKKINPNLADYVTEKALVGIFTQIALEEQNIRKNPAARATNLLQKVFGK